jgi:hypothetical protein
MALSERHARAYAERAPSRPTPSNRTPFLIPDQNSPFAQPQKNFSLHLLHKLPNRAERERPPQVARRDRMEMRVKSSFREVEKINRIYRINSHSSDFQPLTRNRNSCRRAPSATRSRRRDAICHSPSRRCALFSCPFSHQPSNNTLILFRVFRVFSPATQSRSESLPLGSPPFTPSRRTRAHAPPFRVFRVFRGSPDFPLATPVPGAKFPAPFPPS